MMSFNAINQQTNLNKHNKLFSTNAELQQTSTNNKH